MRALERRLVACALAVAGLLACAAPASARIVKTRRAVQSRPGLGFTLGSGFEFQADSEAREYGFPMLFEWALSPKIDFAIEPTFIAIHNVSAPSVQGWDDTESTLSLEIVRERRTRPAFALQGGVKWPTSNHDEIGNGLGELTLGALVSKDFVRGEWSFNAIASRVGVPRVGRVQDTAQLSAALEWHLTPDLDLTAEVLTDLGIGPLRGQSGSAAPGGGGINVSGAGSGAYEGTVGLAHHFGKRLKLEEGLVVQTDGTWQAVMAWEWDFGEGR